MPSARLEDSYVGVGVYADLGGDLKTTTYHPPRGEFGVLDEGARCGKRARSARSYSENSIIGLDDVAGSGDNEAVLAIGYSEQCFETTQNPIAPPIFCQLHCCALQVSGIPLQFFLELLEQCESIRRCTRESGEQFSAMQRADFLRVRFHHGLADGDLPVAVECDLSVPSYREDRGRPDALEIPTLLFKITLPLGLRCPGKGLRCALSCNSTLREARTIPDSARHCGGADRPHHHFRCVEGRGSGAAARASPAYARGAAQSRTNAGRFRNLVHGGFAARSRHVALWDNIGARRKLATRDWRDHESGVPQGGSAVPRRREAG